MPVKKPVRARIAGSYYKINYVPMIEHPEIGELAGDCNSSKQEIRISTNQVEDRQKTTLLHELIHAIADDLNYDWPEATVLQAERLTMMLLRDNPGLLEYIRRKENA